MKRFLFTFILLICTFCSGPSIAQEIDTSRYEKIKNLGTTHTYFRIGEDLPTKESENTKVLVVTGEELKGATKLTLSALIPTYKALYGDDFHLLIDVKEGDGFVTGGVLTMHQKEGDSYKTPDYLQNVENLIISNASQDVVVISDHFLRNSHELKMFTLRNFLKTINIGNYFLFNALGLKTVVFEAMENLLSIGDYFLYSAQKLEHVYISAMPSLQSIGQSFMSQARAITDLDLGQFLNVKSVAPGFLLDANLDGILKDSTHNDALKTALNASFPNTHWTGAAEATATTQTPSDEERVNQIKQVYGDAVYYDLTALQSYDALPPAEEGKRKILIATGKNLYDPVSLDDSDILKRAFLGNLNTLFLNNLDLTLLIDVREGDGFVTNGELTMNQKREGNTEGNTFVTPDYLKNVKKLIISNVSGDVTSTGSGFLAHSISGTLEEVDLSSLSNLVEIGSGLLFNQDKLRNLILPEALPNLTSLGDYFLSRTSLETVDITPFSSLKKIGSSFLSSCTTKKIDLSPLSNLKEIGRDFLRGCDQIQDLDLTPLSNVQKIGSHETGRLQNFLNELSVEQIQKKPYSQVIVDALKVTFPGTEWEVVAKELSPEEEEAKIAEAFKPSDIANLPLSTLTTDEEGKIKLKGTVVDDFMGASDASPGVTARVSHISDGIGYINKNNYKFDPRETMAGSQLFRFIFHGIRAPLGQEQYKKHKIENVLKDLGALMSARALAILKPLEASGEAGKTIADIIIVLMTSQPKQDESGKAFEEAVEGISTLTSYMPPNSEFQYFYMVGDEKHIVKESDPESIKKGRAAAGGIQAEIIDSNTREVINLEEHIEKVKKGEVEPTRVEGLSALKLLAGGTSAVKGAFFSEITKELKEALEFEVSQFTDKKLEEKLGQIPDLTAEKEKAFYQEQVDSFNGIAETVHQMVDAVYDGFKEELQQKISREGAHKIVDSFLNMHVVLILDEEDEDDQPLYTKLKQKLKGVEPKEMAEKVATPEDKQEPAEKKLTTAPRQSETPSAESSAPPKIDIKADAYITEITEDDGEKATQALKDALKGRAVMVNPTDDGVVTDAVKGYMKSYAENLSLSGGLLPIITYLRGKNADPENNAPENIQTIYENVSFSWVTAGIPLVGDYNTLEKATERCVAKIEETPIRGKDKKPLMKDGEPVLLKVLFDKPSDRQAISAWLRKDTEKDNPNNVREKVYCGAIFMKQREN